MNDDRNPRNPFRCYDRTYLLRALGAAVLVVALAFVARGHPPGSGTRLAIGAVQAAIMAWIVIYTMAAIRKLDELMQRIHLEAMAISFTLSGAVFVAYGILDRAGLPSIAWGKWSWVLMVGLWALGVAIRRRHYR